MILSEVQLNMDDVFEQQNDDRMRPSDEQSIN